jgi:hypothetical protein
MTAAVVRHDPSFLFRAFPPREGDREIQDTKE